MPVTADIVFWALTIVAELVAAYILALSGLARKFRWLMAYFIFGALVSIAELVVFWHYGWLSGEYALVYWIAHAIFGVLLYASVSELVLRSLRIARPTRLSGALFAAAMLVIWLSSDLIVPVRIAFITSENLYWLSGAVVACLCVWNVLQIGPHTRERVIAFRLTYVLGVYFVLSAAVFSLQDLTHNGESASTGGALIAVASVWLPIGASLAAMSVPQSS